VRIGVAAPRRPRIRRKIPLPSQDRKRAQRCARQYSVVSIVTARKLNVFAIDQLSHDFLTGSS